MADMEVTGKSTPSGIQRPAFRYKFTDILKERKREVFPGLTKYYTMNTCRALAVYIHFFLDLGTGWR
jgi:hypothetical protein